MPGIWNNMCYVRYRMNEAKIRRVIYICNTSKVHMCSSLSRYVICYLYQLIHVVLCFVLLQLSRLGRFFDLFEFSYSWHCLFPYCFWPLNMGCKNSCSAGPHWLGTYVARPTYYVVARPTYY